jgi:hypothetical protein
MPIGRTARSLAGAWLVCGSVYAQSSPPFQTQNFSIAQASFSQQTTEISSFATLRVTRVLEGEVFGASGPKTIVEMTLFGNMFGPPAARVFVFGCWQIPDADFTSALDGSTLTTTIVPSGPNATPICQGGFSRGTVPVQLNLTWTPTGTTRTTSRQSSESCGAFEAESQTTRAIVRAFASGTITGFVGTADTSDRSFGGAVLSEQQIEGQSQGAPDPSCVFDLF